MMAHTLDIVVPFYNLGGYFKNSLTSLRQQTSTDFAVWLVDDGSTDESLALAKQAAAADDRFHVLTLPRHEGTSAARNAGVDAGTAPLVTFVDADDQVDPRFAATLIAGFQEYQADIVAVGYTWGGGWFRRGGFSGVQVIFGNCQPGIVSHVMGLQHCPGEALVPNVPANFCAVPGHLIQHVRFRNLLPPIPPAAFAAAAGENFWYNPVVLYTKINRPGSTIHSRTWEMSRQEDEVFAEMAAIKQRALASDANSASR